MKTKLLKSLSILLTVSLLAVSASFVSSALGSGDTGASDTSVTPGSGEIGAPVLYGASGNQLETNGPAPALGYLAASGGSVELDGTSPGEVTVSLVATKDFTCYGIEGTWATKELGNTNYFSLTEISSEVLTFGEYDFADVASGEVMWTDLMFTTGTISADAKLLTATYSVAANTPDGTYTVNFVDAVFTGEDGEPDETEPVFTATITVKHHNPTVQAGQAATCEADGWKDYYKCPVCNKFYSDAEGKNEISDLDAWKVGDGKVLATDHAWGEPGYINTDGDTHTANYVCGNDASHKKSETVDHDFTNGDCACGAVALKVVKQGNSISYTVSGRVVTVTCASACKVGYLSGDKYVTTGITKTANSDGSYSFTIPAGVSEVLIVVKGDGNGDGRINVADKTQINAVALRKTTFSAEATFAADVNGDGRINVADKTQVNAVALRKTTFEW